MSHIDKPSSQEDEYFAREDVEKKRKLALQQAEALAAKQKEDLKKLHHMRCPKCGMELQALQRGEVEVDTCFNCKGLWLDAGELEQLVNQNEKSGTVMRSVLNLFKNK